MKASTRMIIAMAFVLPLAAMLLAQQALTGKWQGQTPNGFSVELDLTATDKTVTGTMTREGQTETIAEGKVAKNTFSFKATVNKQTEGFAGELDGDVIKVWLERQGPERAAVLKRVKG